MSVHSVESKFPPTPEAVVWKQGLSRGTPTKRRPETELLSAWIADAGTEDIETAATCKEGNRRVNASAARREVSGGLIV